MSEQFVWHRFRALAVKHYAEKWRSYLGYQCGTLCLFLLIHPSVTKNDNGNNLFLFLFPCVLLLYAIGRMNLNGYVRNPKQVAALTLPASTFEKSLFVWLNPFVAGFLVLVLAASTAGCLMAFVREGVFGGFIVFTRPEFWGFYALIHVLAFLMLSWPWTIGVWVLLRILGLDSWSWLSGLPFLWLAWLVWAVCFVVCYFFIDRMRAK